MSESTKKLKDKILNLAFKGDLLECDKDKWDFKKLSEVGSLKSGVTQDKRNEKNKGRIPYIKVADMNLSENNPEIVTSSRYLDDFNPQNLIPRQSIIFPKRGGAILTNKKRMVNIDIIVDLNIMAFTPARDLDLKYTYYWFLNLDLGKLNNGSSVPQINNKDIYPLVIPVPPLNEQHKIVEIIDKLFIKIDKIEKQELELQKNVELAKAKILDLAIRGLLVKPSNRTADSIISDNYELHKSLVDGGKIKKSEFNKETIIKKYNNIFMEEVRKTGISKEINPPIEIPQHWRWSRLFSVSEEIFAGSDKPKDTIKEKDITHNIPVFSNGLEHSGLYGYTSQARVNKPGITICARGTIGHSFVREEPYFPIIRLISITPGLGIEPKYLKIVFDALRENGGGSSTPQLTVPDIKPKLIPIPPLEEQIRIIEKVENLFAELTVLNLNL